MSPSQDGGLENHIVLSRKYFLEINHNRFMNQFTENLKEKIPQLELVFIGEFGPV